MLNILSVFIDYISFEKRYSVKTVQAYTNDLEQFFSFIENTFSLTSIQEIKHLHIRNWISTLSDNSISARSINRKISTLKSFYKFLQKNNYVTQNPMSKVIAPRVAKKLPIFINESTLTKINTDIDTENDYVSFMHGLIVEILYQTGMRRFELLNIQISDIDFAQYQLKVLGKGNKERIIPLNKSLCNLLNTFIEERNKIAIGHSYLFSLPNGKPLYEKYIYMAVKKELAKYTTMENISPHVLRHTFATHMLNRGADLNAVKELLGHAGLAATQVYTHNTIERLKDVYKKAHPKGEQ